MQPSRLNLTIPSIFSASSGLCSSTLNGPRMRPKTLMTSSATCWASAGTWLLSLIGVTLGIVSSPCLNRHEIPGSSPGMTATPSLQSWIGLAPIVEIDDLGQRTAPQAPEIAHRPADRQDRVGHIALGDTH